MALVSLLRSQPGFDEKSYGEALQHARSELNKVNSLATLRSQISGQRLEEAEKLLRAMTYPK
jgi:hypothetical protein